MSKVKPVAAEEAEEDGGSVAILEEELEVRERLRVDPNCLDEDLGRCASDIAYLGGRYARAMLTQTRAKIYAKKIGALSYLAMKDIAVDTYGEKKATVDVIKAMVDSDASVLAALDDEAVAEVRLSVAKTNVQAAMARKDMLVQVGATRRAEMERDPVIRRRDRPDAD